MSFSETFVRVARNLLPHPFTIAVLLTFVTVILALLLTQPSTSTTDPHIIQIAVFWEQGFWDLLEFSMQMMLILVLGHVLALTRPVEKLIQWVLQYCTTTASAAAVVTFLTIVVGLLNWGLGLIFGAILARKVGDHARQNGTPLNYPLIGAAGYTGLMVWHGGLSGSAPLKVAEANHFLIAQTGQIPLTETLFSPMNIAVTVALIIFVPAAMYWLGKRVRPTALDPILPPITEPEPKTVSLTAAEKLDHSPVLAYLFAGFMLFIATYKAFIQPETFNLAFLNLNYINFLLFGLGITLYGNFSRYVQAVEEAIRGASGIMIQFPIYAGIAGIMQYSGLIEIFSDGIIHVANHYTYPFFTFVSAGVVNVFVPSGGGQWAVQGPIVAEATRALGASMPKAVMALAYGDGLTNMMQPFWALPLLGITRLKAQEILPFTLYLMLLGGIIYTVALFCF